MLKTIARAAASQPRIYELIQEAAGRRAAWRHISRFIPADTGAWLDIGSSSGSFPALRDRSSQAVQLDLDIAPLRLRKERSPDARVVAGDAAKLPFRPRSFDLVTCFAVTHHLDDVTLGAAIAEIARVVKSRFIFFDALREDSRLMSRVLWRYDRGAFPRTRQVLAATLSAHFEIVDETGFSVAHRYWLAVARPRVS